MIDDDVGAGRTACRLIIDADVAIVRRRRIGDGEVERAGAESYAAPLVGEVEAELSLDDPGRGEGARIPRLRGPPRGNRQEREGQR